MELMLVGLWLLAVGAADLLRATGDAISVERRLTTLGVGSAVLGGGLAILDLDSATAVVVWFGGVLALAAWVLGSASALERGTGPGAWCALLGLGGGTIAAILAAGAISGSGAGWPGAFDDTVLARWPVQQVLVVLGVALAELATANIVVRIVLDAVGVRAAPHEKQLKGGRLLGPMERLFIVGLGVAGELAAAAVVVGAKGLLRFPEVQRGVREEVRGGPSDVTEYFLIGSFVSWLLALGGAALVALG